MRKSLKKVKNEAKAKIYRRKLSIRQRIEGSAERPRICVVKTNKHLQVQIVDDSVQKTILTVQTFGKNAVGKGSNKESAKIIGQKVAAGLKGLKIEKAVFDRNGRLYTGVLSTLADSIRENGIQI